VKIHIIKFCLVINGYIGEFPNAYTTTASFSYLFFSYYLVNFILLNKIPSPRPTKCFFSLSFPVYRGLKRTIVIFFIFSATGATLLAAIWRSESCVWKLDVSREMKWSIRKDRLGLWEGRSKLRRRWLWKPLLWSSLFVIPTCP